MNDDVDLQEVRNMWTTQSIDMSAIDIDALRQRASRFQRRIALRNVREYVAAAIVVSVFGWVAVTGTSWISKAGALAVMAGSIYTMYQLHRRGSAEAFDATSGSASCVQFHVATLERQRTALQNVWKWYLAPVAPGVVLFVLGLTIQKPDAWIRGAATIGLCALVFYGIHRLNRRAAEHLEHEIAELRHGLGEPR